MMFVEVQGADDLPLWINVNSILWFTPQDEHRCSATINANGVFHLVQINESVAEVLAKIERQ